jgi:hypothetical protein
MGDCFKRTGTVKKETRILGDFDSIYVDRRLNVILVQDTVNFALIEAGENLLELIDSEVENGKLTLRNNNRCNWVRSYKIPVNIEVHTNNLQHIVMWGASNITNKGTLTFPKLVVEYRDASGNLELMVDNQLMNIIQHTGAGDAVIHGKTEQLTVYMSSLAYGDYTDLNAQNVYVENKSSADCRVLGNQTFTFLLQRPRRNRFGRENRKRSNQENPIILDYFRKVARKFPFHVRFLFEYSKNSRTCSSHRSIQSPFIL